LDLKPGVLQLLSHPDAMSPGQANLLWIDISARHPTRGSYE